MITTKYVGEAAIERIAKAYKEHEDELYLIPEEKIHLCRRISNALFCFLSIDTYFDLCDFEPYSYTNIKEVLEDYKKDIIKVNSTGNNSNFWGVYYNLGFRSSHDFIHCAYNLNFTHKDEVKAFKKQVEYTKDILEDCRYLDILITTKDIKLYEKVLRSEIVYQSAFKTYYNTFHLTEQKIILSDL